MHRATGQLPATSKQNDTKVHIAFQGAAPLRVPLVQEDHLASVLQAPVDGREGPRYARKIQGSEAPELGGGGHYSPTTFPASNSSRNSCSFSTLVPSRAAASSLEPGSAPATR